MGPKWTFCPLNLGLKGQHTHTTKNGVITAIRNTKNITRMSGLQVQTVSTTTLKI